MPDERVSGAVRRGEMPMLRAYRLWFEHTRKCGDGCKGTPRAHDGCEDGRRLWGTYRLTRIGKSGAAS
ncbi:hypothetical protein IQ61_27560 [Streptomyces scabiei]|nr:hypothetical protein IQ61_27560 [Streptomyces scabiei]